MKLTPLNVVAVYAAGIVWVYMFIVWIAACVQAYALLAGAAS